MPRSRVPLYCRNTTVFLRLRELLALAVPASPDDPRFLPKTRTFIPPPGHWLAATQHPTGIIVRLEHRPDGLFLVIGASPRSSIRSWPNPCPGCGGTATRRIRPASPGP